jgi:segregation and condensation protein A
MPVRELELDLDAFEGPFDLLLSLVLRDELPLRELDLAEVVISFVEHLHAKGELDLDACGEFLILISALLELKARAMFPDEEAELAELEPEEAAEELARRLAEYRRAKEAANWLRGRLEERRDYFFRLGPAPLAPKVERKALRFPPTSQFLDRWRALLRRRTRFDFDQEVNGLSRVEIAVAFLALLELRKQNEIAIAQSGPFAPIRISRADAERSLSWTAHSA